MGTKFQIIIYGDSTLAASSSAFSFTEIQRLEKIFSDYDPYSEINLLKKDNQWQQISRELYEVTAYAEKLNKHSKGAFDIKIGNITKIWKTAIKNQEMPDVVILQSEYKKKRKLKLKEKNGFFYLKMNEHIHLDYGGIAKGYAVDRAFQILHNNGLTAILVDGGGDMRMGEPPPGRDYWVIDTNNKLEVEYLLLENCAIASSGDTYQNIQINELTFSHIVQPQTIKGTKKSRLVSVIADQCMVADALATTLSITQKTKKLRKHYHYKARILEGETFIIKDF